MIKLALTWHDLWKFLPNRTASDKTFCDKAFNITKCPKYDGYQRGFASLIGWLIDWLIDWSMDGWMDGSIDLFIYLFI